MDTALLVRILSNISNIRNGISNNNPVSQDDINNLTRRTINTTDNINSCSICHDNMIVHQTVVDLECNHSFHEQCILNWFRRQNTCPNCRAHVGSTPTPDEDVSNNDVPELIAEIPLPRFFYNNDIVIKLSYQLLTNGNTVNINTSWNPRIHNLVDIFNYIRRIYEFNNVAEIVIIGSLNTMHIFRSSQSYSSLSRTLHTIGITSACTFNIHAP
ncbi:MAG: hypothetical protein EBU66_18855 [Bacteroidetes bacterium]|nr:hypothetical protein [bacterium]NBP66693.1 hypothetical protein [Bacteroidota bacterium]